VDGIPPTEREDGEACKIPENGAEFLAAGAGSAGQFL